VFVLQKLCTGTTNNATDRVLIDRLLLSTLV
jgi:hypothetical protein